MHRLKSHQILAINRGERQKVLSVKVEPPAAFKQRFERFCNERFVRSGSSCVRSPEGQSLRSKLLDEAIAEGYKRFGECMTVQTDNTG